MAHTAQFFIDDQVGLVADIIVFLPAGKRPQTTGTGAVGGNNVLIAGTADAGLVFQPYTVGNLVIKLQGENIRPGFLEIQSVLAYIFHIAIRRAIDQIGADIGPVIAAKIVVIAGH